MKLILNNLKDTKKFGKKLAQISKPDEIFCLKGNLGSGKTTIARAFINHFTKNDNNELKTLCNHQNRHQVVPSHKSELKNNNANF